MRVLLLLVCGGALAACGQGVPAAAPGSFSAPAPHFRSGPEMPYGTGMGSAEPGFTAFCAAHPGESLCPP